MVTAVKKSYVDRQADLVMVMQQQLTRAWRITTITHQSIDDVQPPAWEAKKQEILAEHTHITSWASVCKLDAAAAFDEACQNLNL